MPARYRVKVPKEKAPSRMTLEELIADLKKYDTMFWKGSDDYIYKYKEIYWMDKNKDKGAVDYRAFLRKINRRIERLRKCISKKDPNHTYKGWIY